MSYVIDQNLCVSCGSCFGNCPNRAIIRKGEVCFVTEMCSDCGSCTYYCPMDAIGKGEIKAELNNKILDKALKDKLSLKRHIVAMKYTDKAPEGVPVEEGPQFWCGICGDVFDGDGKPVYFTAPASTCGGSAMIGLGAAKSSKENFSTVINGIVVGEGNLYASIDLLAKERSVFPRFKKIYRGVTVGSLENVTMPELILFPVNSHQMCMVSTAFAFDTGEIITGFAGSAACVMTIPLPLMENKPVFSVGDHGGRTHMRLKDDEFLLGFPYRLVPGLVKNLDRTVFAND